MLEQVLTPSPPGVVKLIVKVAGWADNVVGVGSSSLKVWVNGPELIPSSTVADPLLTFAPVADTLNVVPGTGALVLASRKVTVNDWLPPSGTLIVVESTLQIRWPVNCNSIEVHIVGL